MKWIIKEMTPEYYYGKSYVLYTSWNESYRGLIADEILNARSIEKCFERTKMYPKNTLVALVDNEVVGFSCYTENSIHRQDCPEVMALYVLRKYQGYGIGKALLESSIARLPNKDVVLYVLKGNDRAISFYEHYGFRLTNVVEKLKMGNIEVEALEMILKRNN